MVPLALAIMMAIEIHSNLCYRFFSRRSKYFVVFCCIFSIAKQSLVYENSIS